MTRSERLYRVLLRAYPRSTREALGDDMAQLFVDQLRDAASPAGLASVWARAVADIAIDASRDRASGRRLARVAAGPVVASRQPLRSDLAAASAPLLLAGVLQLVAPGFFGPLLDERATLLGVPMGIALTVPFGLCAGLGILATRRGGLSDGRTRLLAAAWLAVPLPVLFLFYGGVSTALAYALFAALLLVVASVRWLSFAVLVPYVLWLVLGPAIILVLINLGSSGI